eukprot:3614359-Alexandrium_andersonii.AAC.1
MSASLNWLLLGRLQLPVVASATVALHLATRAMTVPSRSYPSPVSVVAAGALIARCVSAEVGQGMRRCCSPAEPWD